VTGSQRGQRQSFASAEYPYTAVMIVSPTLPTKPSSYTNEPSGNCGAEAGEQVRCIADGHEPTRGC
jgi:hypothetical protein